MIIYSTQNTIEDYKVKMPDELVYPVNVIAKSVIEKEAGDKLLEWGCKSFEFDGIKCLQLTNFECMFTVFLIDWEDKDLHNVPMMLVQYIMDIYSDDKEMQRCVRCMLQETSGVCFSNLTDQKVLAVMNRTQRQFAADGYNFYNYISDGVMRTRQINKDVNFKHFLTAWNELPFTGDMFRKLVTERYADTELIHFPVGGGICACGKRH